MTNEQHNKYIGWSFLAHGAFQLLMTLMIGLIFFFIFTIPDQPGQPGPPPEFFGLIFGFMLVFQMLFVVPSLVAAYAVFKRKKWARIVSIVAGVLGAMNVPIGTAACVYSLWFFLGENWKSIYGDGAVETGRDPRVISRGEEARWSGYQTNEQGEVTYRPVEPPDWR